MKIFYFISGLVLSFSVGSTSFADAKFSGGYDLNAKLTDCSILVKEGDSQLAQYQGPAVKLSGAGHNMEIISRGNVLSEEIQLQASLVDLCNSRGPGRRREFLFSLFYPVPGLKFQKGQVFSHYPHSPQSDQKLKLDGTLSRDIQITVSEDDGTLSFNYFDPVTKIEYTSLPDEISFEYTVSSKPPHAGWFSKPNVSSFSAKCKVSFESVLISSERQFLETDRF